MARDIQAERKAQWAKKGRYNGRWTVAEDTLLQMLYQRGGLQLALERVPLQYPHRTAKSVGMRAHRLDLTARNLPLFDHQTRKKIPALCTTEMAFELGMSGPQFVRDVLPKLSGAMKRGKLWAVPIESWEAYKASLRKYPEEPPYGYYITRQRAEEVLGLSESGVRRIAHREGIGIAEYRPKGKSPRMAYLEKDVFKLARKRKL